MHGVTDGTRTRDFQGHILALYQLNYGHHELRLRMLAEPIAPTVQYLPPTLHPMTAPSEEGLRVTPSLLIPDAELVWRYSASGGPGGQHANTANTRAEVVWDIANSPTISESQRERLVAKLGDEVRVVATDERSQLRNRNLASARLAERVRGALHVPRSRRATRPTRGSVQRRLSAKSRNAEVKSQRRRPPDGGD